MTDQDQPTGRISEYPTLSAIDDFANTMAAILKEHRPSRMPCFGRLAALPSTVVSDPSFLGQILLVYQSAMHATRAAVYYLPHLDSPALRKRKLQIFIDDDGLPNGDTHHYQLTRAFLEIGAKCLLDEEEFGEPGELCHYLEAETAHFVRLAPKLYARSLGPWCAVEMMSADWMRALADALSVHFPHFKHEQYFEDCFSQKIEERHAAEALEVTQMVAESASGTASRDTARRQDDRGGAGRGVDPFGQDRPERQHGGCGAWAQHSRALPGACFGATCTR